jgi:hypothetical protein
MINILFAVFLIIVLYLISSLIEPFDKCVKQETIQSVLGYPNESIDPLFDATFKPECCPTTYSSSSGCLCYEPKNFNLLATRGGNSLSNPL